MLELFKSKRKLIREIDELKKELLKANQCSEDYKRKYAVVARRNPEANIFEMFHEERDKVNALEDKLRDSNTRITLLEAIIRFDKNAAKREVLEKIESLESEIALFRKRTERIETENNSLSKENSRLHNQVKELENMKEILRLHKELCSKGQS